MAINHVTLAVTNLDSSFAFYCDTLEARPIMRSHTSAYLELEGLWIALVAAERITPIGKDCYTHLAFTASDSLYRKLLRLVDAGSLPTWQENTSEGDSIYFLDPDGNKLELHKTTLKDRIAHGKLYWGSEVTWYL
jgi:catechol 2,3-dioxygenase-like lactoylglutathione lyase family enzyme